jgi:hypothetical protein
MLFTLSLLQIIHLCSTQVSQRRSQGWSIHSNPSNQYTIDALIDAVKEKARENSLQGAKEMGPRRPPSEVKLRYGEVVPGTYSQGSLRNYLIFGVLSFASLANAFESTCICATLPVSFIVPFCPCSYPSPSVS